MTDLQAVCHSTADMSAVAPVCRDLMSSLIATEVDVGKGEIRILVGDHDRYLPVGVRLSRAIFCTLHC